MKVLEIIAYILIAIGAVRLMTTRGSCPGGWGSLAIGVILLLTVRK